MHYCSIPFYCYKALKIILNTHNAYYLIQKNCRTEAIDFMFTFLCIHCHIQNKASIFLMYCLIEFVKVCHLLTGEYGVYVDKGQGNVQILFLLLPRN